ncbi:pyridoxine 5'-phosphate oxidase C-terminal domain-containing protein [Streptomyces sp. NPDC001193]
MSHTPHRRATAAGALVAAAALLAVGIQAGTASADATASQARNAAQPNPGAAAVNLSPSERATLIADANSTTVQAAKEIEQAGGMRQWLRGLEVFAGPLPDFDPEPAPAYTQAPAEAEFRQAAKSRIHTRLRYERTRDGWERFRLWS